VLGFAVPLELTSADGDLRLITTLTSFATATAAASSVRITAGGTAAGRSGPSVSDVTLAELPLEAFLPADEHTADVLRRRWG
jgi:hypothetical protein